MESALQFLSDHLFWILLFGLPLIIPLVLFQILPVLVLMERRGAAFIQDRIGPNRANLNISAKALGVLTFKREAIASIFQHERDGDGVIRLRAFGMLFNLADLVKILFKEHFVAPFADKLFYQVAPVLPLFFALISTALLPWFAPFSYLASDGSVWRVVGQGIDAHSGLLALFAVGSLGVYGIVLGSWASNSKYSLLGGMRASAMMISYEVSMGLSVLGLLLIYGSFSLTDAVTWQTNHVWGIVAQPMGGILFLIALFAETNRNPFDVAEGESEIVAGFHTEFNGIRFMLFMTAEYFHIMLASALFALLFLGGWDLVPFAHWDSLWLRDHLGWVLAAMAAMGGLGALGFCALLVRRRTHYGRSTASDKVIRVREYGVYAGGAAVIGILLIIASAFVCRWNPEAVGTTMIGDAAVPVFSNLVNLIAAFVQFNVLIVKALAVAWLFVWVRWTLPRFRYDQIMGLGWKVLLNIALVNLLITALIAKLVRG